jgi:two-component system, OmpR family, response regulator
MGGPRSNRLLLIEDDAELAGMLSETLADEGYLVDQAYDGQRGLHLGLTRAYDVMVIDRLLPGVDGLDLVMRLRSRAVPARTLMLSALSTVHDRVAGLDAGADDFLGKPFDLDELSARVRALCRRTADSAEALRLGAGLLDLALRDAVLPGGSRVPLSAREFDLLRVLAERPKAVHSRAELRSRVFAEATAPSIVDTYVYYVRRKLGRAVVRTVHGLGYRLGAL